MSKMSIADAATHFGVSREAIHNRIRRGSLSSVVEDGVKLVIVDKTNTTATRTPTKKPSVNSNDKYYKLLEEQNAKLQEKVEKLENETRSLRDQKEQMLIDDRIKIEQIYKDKDEQLKNILNSFKAQFMLSSPKENEEKIDSIEAEIEVEESQRVSAKRYIKELQLSAKKEKKLLDKVKKIAKKDDRIIQVGKKFYLDFNQHDYNDIFKK